MKAWPRTPCGLRAYKARPEPIGDWLPDVDGRFLGETLTPRRWDGSKLINIDHNQLIGILTDQHHAKLHASSHEKGGGDVLGVVVAFKFGAEGATTTSTVYVTIANSDVAFNPALFKLKTTLYVKFIYHIKNDTAGQTTYMRVLRQNAGTPVSGSEASVVGAGWGIVETSWIDWSGESGNESYQVQLKVTGGVGEFNSALMVLSPVQL